MNITGFSPLNFPQLVRNIDYDNLTLDTVTVNNTVTIPLNSLTIGNTSGLATALNTHTTTDTNHNSRLLTQESTTDSHEIDINTVQAEVVTLQNNDVVQDTNIATNTSDITTLQSNDLTHDYNINTNTSNISTLQSVEVSQNADIVSLQNLTAIHVNNIALNSTVGSINDGKIGVLETNDVIQDSNILTNTNDITALQTNDSTQDSDINLNTSSINTLQSFFATLNGSVVSNTNDITTLQTNDTTQDSNISTNANSITALQTTVVSLNDDIQTNKTDILTKQDTLTSATSINLNMLSIGNVSGFLQNGSIYAENKIEANFMHVTGGALLLSDSTNSDNLDIYFSHSPHTSDGFNTNIMQGVTFYSGTYENMNLENVIGIKNDSVIANRYVDIVSKTNIKNELNVYSLNLLKTTNPSIKLIDIDDTGLMILNNQGGIETIKLDNAFGNITVSGNLDAQYGTITGNTITGNIHGNLLAGTDITLSEANGITTINSTGGGSSFTAGSNIDITNDVISAVDNPIFASRCTAGSSKIWSSGTSAYFSNSALSNSQDAALIQRDSGLTILNTSLNKELLFRTNGTIDMAKIDTQSEFWITRAGSLTKINDLIDNVTLTTSTPIFVSSCTAGASKISSTGTTALFGNSSLPNWQDSALIQWNTGHTFINTPIGKQIEFRQGGISTMAKIDNNGELYITRAGSLTKINDLIDNVTLTTSTPIIGEFLDIDVGNQGTYQIGVTKIGNTGHTSASISYGNFHTTSSYGFMQNSAGSSFVNCHNGKSVHIRVSNSDKVIVDSASITLKEDVTMEKDLTVSGVVNAINNCHIMTMDTGNAASGTSYLPDWTITIKTNSSLYAWTTPTTSATSGLKVLRDGYYKFNINENYQSITYNNRVSVWSNLVINNTPDYNTSSYCYIRANAYAGYLGTNYHNVTRYLNANDYVKISATIAKGNTNFGASWDVGGVFKRQGYDNFEVTYLGN